VKKLLVLVLLAALALAAYVYWDPELRSRWLRGTPLVEQPRTTPLYRWRDAQGEWQISDRPPPPGTAYDTHEYSRDLNVLPLPAQLTEDD